jgi:hypothetical protein
MDFFEKEKLGTDGTFTNFHSSKNLWGFAPLDGAKPPHHIALAASALARLSNHTECSGSDCNLSGCLADKLSIRINLQRRFCFYTNSHGL